MTNRNENNENNELNEQELEQTAGGFSFSSALRDLSINYRCPKCGATKKVKMPDSIIAPMCTNGHLPVRMEKA